MNVDVRIRTADLNDALRTYIERRLRFSLGRFARTLGRVRIQVERVAGARVPLTRPAASVQGFSLIGACFIRR